MAHSFPESDTWDLCTGLPLDIPSEEAYQRYLIALHYQTLEYLNYSARFSPKRMAKVQWFVTDIAMA